LYITDKFAFIELPKTGSTYIDQIMIDMLDGEKKGKHDYPSKNLLNSGKSFIASIRNPYDWYVSLWAYGCKVKERSGPYRKTVSYRPFDLRGYAFDKNILFGSKAYLNYLVKAPFAGREAWKAAYSDSKDPQRFQRWIHLMFEAREAYLHNSIFAQTRLQSFIGPYTFRYLWLCCRDREELLTNNCPSNMDELRLWEDKNCYVDRFIRMENIPNDLMALFEHFGYDVGPKNLARIQENKRHNFSKRDRDTNLYYDEESRKYVANREKLIFEKFDYSIDG